MMLEASRKPFEKANKAEMATATATGQKRPGPAHSMAKLIVLLKTRGKRLGRSM